MFWEGRCFIRLSNVQLLNSHTISALYLLTCNTVIRWQSKAQLKFHNLWQREKSMSASCGSTFWSGRWWLTHASFWLYDITLFVMQNCYCGSWFHFQDTDLNLLSYSSDFIHKVHHEWLMTKLISWPPPTRWIFIIIIIFFAISLSVCLFLFETC